MSLSNKIKMILIMFIMIGFSSAASARFVGVDPKGFDENNIHSFNRYAYANNNPNKYVDPDGRDSVVAIGGATKSNPFGHAAIGFTGQGVYSYGTGTPLGSSLTDYLTSQATYRDTTVYILKTTPEQEALMKAAILKYEGVPLPDPRKDPLGAEQDTCASRTQRSLEAGGISTIYEPLVSPFPGDTAIVASHNAKSEVGIPKGGKIPDNLSTFNPQ